MLVIGAGQLSAFVTRFAVTLGYEVIVCDPRENYRGSWNEPDISLSADMPDDFVTIHFNVSPGQTTFFFGDTITVDASEQYEIIQVGYTTQNTVGDGLANNTCKGIAFCARIV